MKGDFYYPGWVRKAITFTIDDGNVRLDKKFMDYTKPAGFKGTFNLITPLHADMTAEDYRRFYAGYEIANHCRYHAYPLWDDKELTFAHEKFPQEGADKSLVYDAEEEGLYRVFTYAWTYLATADKYMECVDRCQKELEDVFGKGKIKGYIWPCGEQKNAEVFKRLCNYGFGSIRKTGCVEDSTGFALPADRMRWSYTCNYTDMADVGAKYDAYPDDGNLKFLCFGVHSHDFENNGCWTVLEDFCAKYGNRPETFWYATVGEIFDYEDAVKVVEFTDDGRIVNHSPITVYLAVNGKRITLWGNSEVKA